MLANLLDFCSAFLLRPDLRSAMRDVEGAIVRTVQPRKNDTPMMATGFFVGTEGLVLTNEHQVEGCVATLTAEQRMGLRLGKEVSCPHETLFVERFSPTICSASSLMRGTPLPAATPFLLPLPSPVTSFDVSLVALGSNVLEPGMDGSDLSLVRLKQAPSEILGLAISPESQIPTGSLLQMGFPAAPRFGRDELSLRRKEVEDLTKKAKQDIVRTCARRTLEALGEYEDLAFGRSPRIVPADSTLRVGSPTKLEPSAGLMERIRAVLSLPVLAPNAKRSKEVETIVAGIVKDLCLKFDLDSSAESKPKAEALTFIMASLSSGATTQQKKEGTELATQLANTLEKTAKGTFQMTPTAGGGFSGSPLVDAKGVVVGLFARASKTFVSRVEFVPLVGVFVDASSIRTFLEKAGVGKKTLAKPR